MNYLIVFLVLSLIGLSTSDFIDGHEQRKLLIKIENIKKDIEAERKKVEYNKSVENEIFTLDEKVNLVNLYTKMASEKPGQYINIDEYKNEKK